MAPAELIDVEVAYALPQRQWLRRVRVARGTTVAGAVQASGLLEQCPGIVLEEGMVGIFSRPVPLSRELSGGERVEIYRPLAMDPKQARRQRAAVRRRR